MLTIRYIIQRLTHIEKQNSAPSGEASPTKLPRIWHTLRNNYATNRKIFIQIVLVVAQLGVKMIKHL